MERQLGKATKVLSDCGKRKFEPRAGRSTQSQAAEPQNPLEVRKQHLNLLAISSGLIVGRRLGDRAGNIARCLVHVACDLPARRVWTAFGLQRAYAAIGDAREIRDSVIPRVVRVLHLSGAGSCRWGRSTEGRPVLE